VSFSAKAENEPYKLGITGVAIGEWALFSYSK